VLDICPAAVDAEKVDAQSFALALRYNSCFVFFLSLLKFHLHVIAFLLGNVLCSTDNLLVSPFYSLTLRNKLLFHFESA